MSTINIKKADGSYEIVADTRGKMVIPSYSETEYATGETWINGKPIYRKAFPDTTVLGTAGTLAPKGNKSFAMSTLIPDIETITNQYILIRITNICDFNPIGTIGITAANTIRTDSAWTALYTGNTGASSAIYITNARDIAFTDNDVYIFGWVEYTKKTD